MNRQKLRDTITMPTPTQSDRYEVRLISAGPLKSNYLKLLPSDHVQIPPEAFLIPMRKLTQERQDIQFATRVKTRPDDAFWLEHCRLTNWETHFFVESGMSRDAIWDLLTRVGEYGIGVGHTGRFTVAKLERVMERVL